MRIGRHDVWNEYDAVASVTGGHTEAMKLAQASSMANHMTQCWNIAKESLMAFGCGAWQAEQLMSNTKDIRLLNGCDELDPTVHALRAYLGRSAHRCRLNLRPAPGLDAESCIGTGIHVFRADQLGLTQEQQEALERELSSSAAALSKNETNMAYGRRWFENCTELLNKITPFLSEVTGYSEGTITEELSRTAFAQRVINGPEDNDVQKVLHQDTWHDAWKLWYFPRAVRDGEGPFRFAQYSHGLSSERMRLTTAFATKGTKWEEWRSYGHDEGSWRVDDVELLRMGCGASDVTCAAGTLVVANVFGYHARGEATETKERIALHASIRLNPWKN